MVRRGCGGAVSGVREGERMDIDRRNNVTVTGNPHGRTVVLAHGFGCDQNMAADRTGPDR
ncbi:hypothetical protein GCM10010269_14360 [Streptomyces humidus]|uniref:Alpha/beta hydrolase n=1 Tax=Streptomyces humidus TaxID=52259 RepID=A0A918FT93_9ACTN|nr:hypothetical protein GCM10010269_14360 [Streptomyces humidus]